jgi:hypothetical protein
MQAGARCSSVRRKGWLDSLFLCHALCAASCGALAFVFPHVFGFFLGEEWHDGFRYNPTDDPEVKVAHVCIRLYGALILGQAPIVWHIRKTESASVRRGVVQAYTLVFTLTTLALVRAILTDDHWHLLAWLNVVLFGGLAAAYGFFSFILPEPVFQGLGKSET